MKIRVLSQKEFVAGILFMLIGLCWAYASSKYDLGTATDMGPGYFPMAVSIAITIMGACSVVRATRVVDLDKIGGWSPFAFAIILLSVVSFGLLLNYVGLVPASIALILINRSIERGGLRQRNSKSSNRFETTNGEYRIPGCAGTESDPGATSNTWPTP
jgi:hypothetical protein